MKRSADQIIAERYGPWWKIPELTAEAARYHNINVDRCVAALDYHNRRDRMLEVLIIHGSSRSSLNSSAQELSNSQLLLEYGAKHLLLDPSVRTTRVHLQDQQIEPCNGCLSTTSALCGFPCNCFPFDPMQQLYPLVLQADLLLISTPVNQAAMSTRLKTFVDRLISLDGGFLVDKGQYEPKDAAHRARMIALAETGEFEYAQRMFGRVAAYFISSKDTDNPSDAQHQSYTEMVANSLKVGFETFGVFHADPWYVTNVSQWDEDYCYDKQRLNQNDLALAVSAKVVEAALDLTKQYREKLPEPKQDRVNRT